MRLPARSFAERGWCERLVDVAAPDSPLHLRMVLSPGPTPAARALLPRRLRQLPAEQQTAVQALEVCPQVRRPGPVEAGPARTISQLPGQQSLGQHGAPPAGASPAAYTRIHSQRPPLLNDARMHPPTPNLPSPQGMALAESLARRVSQHGGAALVIDYGQVGACCARCCSRSSTPVRAHTPSLHPTALGGARPWPCCVALCQHAHLLLGALCSSQRGPSADPLLTHHRSCCTILLAPAHAAGRAVRGLSSGHPAARVCRPAGAAGQRRPEQPRRLLGAAVRRPAACAVPWFGWFASMPATTSSATGHPAPISTRTPEALFFCCALGICWLRSLACRPAFHTCIRRCRWLCCCVLVVGPRTAATRAR